GGRSRARAGRRRWPATRISACSALQASRAHRQAYWRCAASCVGGACSLKSGLARGECVQPRDQAWIGWAPVDLLAPVEIAERARQSDRDDIAFLWVGKSFFKSHQPARDLAALVREPAWRMRRRIRPETGFIKHQY